MLFEVMQVMQVYIIVDKNNVLTAFFTDFCQVTSTVATLPGMNSDDNCIF